MARGEPVKGWFTQVSDIAAQRLHEMAALRQQLEQARELYVAMVAELNELRAENKRLRLTLSRSDSDEMRLLRAENERMRAALEKIDGLAHRPDFHVGGVQSLILNEATLALAKPKE